MKPDPLTQISPVDEHARLVHEAIAIATRKSLMLPTREHLKALLLQSGIHALRAECAEQQLEEMRGVVAALGDGLRDAARFDLLRRIGIATPSSEVH